MTTRSHEQANPAYSQRSTGPIAIDGRARSFANSRTYGLCAQNVIAGVEDRDEFENMAAGFRAEFEPVGPSGRVLLQELVTAAWQLRRLRAMEAECCMGGESYWAMVNDEPLQQKLDRLARHHTRVERTFHRCLKELKATCDEQLYEEARLSADRMRRRSMAVATNISERTQFCIQADCENIFLAA